MINTVVTIEESTGELRTVLITSDSEISEEIARDRLDLSPNDEILDVDTYDEAELKNFKSIQIR